MISFIIVNYKSENELLRCLTDLSSIPGAQSCEVIIVNNDQKKLALPTFSFEKQVHVELNQNIGYAAANNKGFSCASKKHICFLNPDTYGFSDNIMEITSQLHDHVIISPSILSEDGTVQKWSVGNEISISEILKNNCGLNDEPWLSKYETPVMWASGAALFVNRGTFERIGKFDENFFLYFEDADLCYRAREEKIEILYNPLISIYHSCGRSSVKTPQKQKKCYYRSQDLFFKKHRGKFQLALLRFFRFFHW
jgi:GT2 family glycosyltransferase